MGGPPKSGATASAMVFQSVTTSALAGPGRVRADRCASARAYATHAVAPRRPTVRRMVRMFMTTSLYSSTEYDHTQPTDCLSTWTTSWCAERVRAVLPDSRDPVCLPSGAPDLARRP